LLKHLLGYKLSSLQFSYSILHLASSFSLIPSLLYPQCSPSPELFLEQARLAILTGVSLLATRVGFFVARMGFSVCPFGLLNQSLDPVEPRI